jgi:hypothetical protein
LDWYAHFTLEKSSKVRFAQKIIDLLDIAGQTCEKLSEIDANSQDELQDLCKRFVELCKVRFPVPSLLLSYPDFSSQDVKLSMRDHLDHIIDNNPYRNVISSYGAKKGLEVAAMKTSLIHSQLQDLSLELQSQK